MEYLLGHSWGIHLDVDGAFIWTFMWYLWNIGHFMVHLLDILWNIYCIFHVIIIGHFLVLLMFQEQCVGMILLTES